MNGKVGYKDVQVISIIASALALVGLAQALFFENPGMNFDPHVIIYIYGGLGVLGWFALNRERKLEAKHLVVILVIARLSILLVQGVAYIAGPYYNEANEVAYYEELSAVLVNPSYFSIFQTIRYGMPPGYQGWLLVYRIAIFQFTTGFGRDIVFSLWNVAFEAGTLHVMIHMTRTEAFNKFTRIAGEKRQELLHAGLMFYTVSVFNIYYSNVRNFMEPITIFLAMLGLYQYFLNHHGRSAVCLAISTMMKFIPIFWLLLIVLNAMKKRDVRAVRDYLMSSAGVASVGFLASSIVFGENVVDYVLAFFSQFYDWSVLAGKGLQLNQAIWYPLYTPVFFLVGLAIIAAVAMMIVAFEDELPLHAFTAITSMYFIFQPWYDQRYVLWILPLLCLDMQGSKRQFSSIVWLFYASVFCYLVFMHPVMDLGINTTFGNDSWNVGLAYRLTGQLVSYVGFGIVCGKQLHDTIKTTIATKQRGGTIRRPRAPPADGTGNSD